MVCKISYCLFQSTFLNSKNGYLLWNVFHSASKFFSGSLVIGRWNSRARRRAVPGFPPAHGRAAVRRRAVPAVLLLIVGQRSHEKLRAGELDSVDQQSASTDKAHNPRRALRRLQAARSAPKQAQAN